MLNSVRKWSRDIRSSFWFVPALIVSGAVCLAGALIAVDASFDLHVITRWPLVFGAEAAGSRGLLTTVAGSMITVAGVVFSITIVALSLTSSQYTSRVLRSFMRDPVNQVVLGVFVGIFAYCLVVLRTVREGVDGSFVPSLAVLGALILAFVGIAFLIYFIHHISVSIQASSIIAAAAQETIETVDHLFPEDMGNESAEDDGADLESALGKEPWFSVASSRTGYIESVDGDALLALAQARGIVVRMERGVGDFVVAHTRLASITGDNKPDKETVAELNALYVTSRQRTVQQDAAYGIRQIVDIALKALSPGINDSTTAVMCVDYLSAILVRLAVRRLPQHYRMCQGQLRVIARSPGFEILLSEAFDQIRQSAEGNAAVLKRLLQTLETVAGETVTVRRRNALQHEARLIAAVARRADASPRDRTEIEASLARLLRIHDDAGAGEGLPSATEQLHS